MDKKLKTIEFVLNKEIDEDALKAVSIVKDPAIEKGFQFFNKLLKQELFSITSEEKMEITGPVMVPNKKILRFNEDTKEYYNCIFSEKTIRECASMYLKHSNHLYANLDHENNYMTGIHVSESWIVEDPELDKSKALKFENVNKGDWFMTYKVEDVQLWNFIKTNGFTGFSIEGYFSNFEKLINEDYKTSFILSVLNSDLNDDDKSFIISNTIK